MTANLYSTTLQCRETRLSEGVSRNRSVVKPFFDIIAYFLRYESITFPPTV